ncbi:MAG: hypothetical protein AABY83_04945 [Pseudomonadota bacterium]
MRLKNFSELFRYKRYRQLRRDFYNPWQALLCSTGMSRKAFELYPRGGEKIISSREDRPIWEAYFNPVDCAVEFQRGLFYIKPHDKKFSPYHIAGGMGAATYRPRHWNTYFSKIPLLAELEQAEKSYCSQNGEDGIIQYLLQRIPVTHRYLVEFGAHDGINMSNSRHWIAQHAWSALLIEADPRFFKQLKKVYAVSPNIKTLKSFVTPENIDALFASAGVPQDFELLSIDIDSLDYYVWQGLRTFQPKVVVIEFNSCFPPQEYYVVAKEQAIALGATSKAGASLRAFYELGLSKGYQLIYCELAGANAFFIHESCKKYFAVDWGLLTPELLYQPPQFGLLSAGKAPNGRGYA